MPRPVPMRNNELSPEWYRCAIFTVSKAKITHPEYAEYLDSALNDIMEQIGDYKGFAVALDEPMAVLCRYVCMLRSEEGVVSDAWRERIEAIDEGRYAIEFSGGYDAQVLRIRVRALRAAAGLGDGIDYLADASSWEAVQNLRLARISSLLVG